jgi:hypothetical protein
MTHLILEHKYIRHEGVGIILWPRGMKDIRHDEMAAFVQQHHPGAILSAGFAKFSSGTPVCFGESLSLDLSSRIDDSAVLSRQLGL